jgi:heme A synthase
VFTVLLIGMGGVLCVTHSIRNCPDWPRCLNTGLPPLEAGPILEIAHRSLAAISGLLILVAAIAGMARTRRLRWIAWPPLVACLLVVEVSYFGARVVLHRLAPGWAAVDVGSALVVVALMVATAVTAQARLRRPDLPDRLTFRQPVARLALVTTLIVYGVLVSGVLVAGDGSTTACLGWPVYSPHQFAVDAHGPANALRLVVSGAGIVMMLAVLVQARHARAGQPELFGIARWLGVAVALEALTQVLLLVFGSPTPLLVVYTVTMAALWGLLVALAVRTGLDVGPEERVGERRYAISPQVRGTAGPRVAP